jgi:hypothetical protein
MTSSSPSLRATGGLTGIPKNGLYPINIKTYYNQYISILMKKN